MLHNFRPQLEEALKAETDPKAIHLLTELLAQNEESKGIEDIATGNDYMRLAKHYVEQRRYADALPFCHQTEKIWMQGEQALHLDTAELHSTIGIIYSNIENAGLAIQYFYNALIMYETLDEKDSEMWFDTYSNLACIYSNLGAHSTALEMCDEFIPRLIKLHGEKSVRLSNAYFMKAAVYYANENFPVALNHFQKAAEIVAALLPKGDKHIRDFVHNYATALNRCKKYIPAALFQKHLRFINTKYAAYFR